jgi:flagellar hook-length control protein FliK
LENVRPISLDMLLGVTSRTGASRSAGRSQAGGLSEADGQPKEFVLPDDDAPAADVAAPKDSPGHSRTDMPGARPESSGDRHRSRDPLGTGRDDQAVNPLAATSQPEPAQGPAVTVTQGTVDPSNALKMAGAAQQQSGPAANGVTGVAKWWQFAQVANQPATGQAQAMSGQAVAAAPAWLQAQGNAQAAAGGPQQPTGHVQTATTPVANTTAGQAAGTDLSPHAPRMSAPADTAATTTATATGQTVPGAANQVAPAGAEAKTTLPNALPTAAAGEAAQTAPPSQASQTSQANQAGGHGAATQSLADIVQQSMASAVGEKAPAEMDPNLQAQAKLIDRAELASKFRSASLPEQADPGEQRATAVTSIMGASHQVNSAAQAPPQPAAMASEHRVAEASRPADQIIENVRQAVANGQRDVTINLNPPELGRVRLRMYAEGNEIRGRIEVENPRTLTEIRHQAEMLTQRLAEDGIVIRRLDVHQMSNTGGQAGSFSPQHHENAAQTPWSHARPTPGEQQRGRESADLAAAAGRRAPAGADQSPSTGGLNVWM